jgi:hypothetical protein
MASLLTVPDRYISDFDIEKSCVGPLLAQGRQHMIYRYKDTQVIKIPQRSLYMLAYGSLTYDEIVAEIRILKTFLPDFVPETHVLQTARHNGYVIVQEFLPDFEFITPLNLPLVAHDLHKITLGNHAIIRKHQVSLDLLGNKGLQQSLAASLFRQRARALMNNVLLIKRSDGYGVRIIDFNLLHLRKDCRTVNRFRCLVDYLCFEFSKYLLNTHFSLEL